MNYGYNNSCKNWQEDKKIKLANKLQQLLSSLKLEFLKERDKLFPPYIEVDKLYPGVRIRKITNLTDTCLDNLIKQSDKIYNKIMS